MGQNGTGKTTTINLFLGFTKPTSGELKINDISVIKNPEKTKKHIAYIPETVTLYTNLTGIENLKFFLSLAGFKYSKIITDLNTAEQVISRLLKNYSNVAC